ncbi:MAG: hypothetical protein KAI45_02515 [Melioribacteraceae bacterium]|nr:hypothetical protein [Melioribacteraceae bacterium]
MSCHYHAKSFRFTMEIGKRNLHWMESDFQGGVLCNTIVDFSSSFGFVEMTELMDGILLIINKFIDTLSRCHTEQSEVSQTKVMDKAIV